MRKLYSYLRKVTTVIDCADHINHSVHLALSQ